MNKIFLIAGFLVATSVAHAMPPSASGTADATVPSGHPMMPGHPPVSGQYQPDGSPVGHPTVEQANKTLKLPASVDPATLPHQGMVLKTYPSNAYVYVQVENEGKTLWLATGSFPVKEGDVIRYGRGNVMTNFYSKKLDMTFPEVLFVSQAVTVGK